MGGSVHRVEILLVGIMVLLAGTLIGALTLLRPPQPAYTTATPLPIGSGAALHTKPAPDDLIIVPIGIPARLPDWPALPPVFSITLIVSGSSGLLLLVGRRIRILVSAHRPLVAIRRLQMIVKRIVTDHCLRMMCICKQTFDRIRMYSLTIPAFRLPIEQKQPVSAPLLVHTPPHEAPTAEDLVLVVAGALANIWATLGLTSGISGFDTPVHGKGSVQVMMMPDSGDEAGLAEIPTRMAQTLPGCRVTWHRSRLQVTIPAHCATSLSCGPLIAPLLEYGRRNQTIRFHTFGWAGNQDSHTLHLGIYGTGAPGALHALLISLLYTQSPDSLALTIFDQGQIAPFYRNVPHLAPPPGDAITTIDLICRAIRRGQRPTNRPLLLVLVEPEPGLLNQTGALVQRLRQHPDMRIHLIISQERPIPEGRELYAQLPALYTETGHTRWFSGHRTEDSARLAIRGTTIEGRLRTLDPAQANDLLARLPARITLPPAIWNITLHPTFQPAEQSYAASHDQAALMRHLARAVGIEPHPPPGTPVEPDCDSMLSWPAGPDLSPTDVGALIERLLKEPTIINVVPPGITRGRLAHVLPAAARHHAEAIMVWLDAAGVLDEPRAEHVRWREPRMIKTHELEWIAKKLRDS